jgi:hypothetical protein
MRVVLSEVLVTGTVEGMREVIALSAFVETDVVGASVVEFVAVEASSVAVAVEAFADIVAVAVVVAVEAFVDIVLAVVSVLPPPVLGLVVVAPVGHHPLLHRPLRISHLLSSSRCQRFLRTLSGV